MLVLLFAVPVVQAGTVSPPLRALLDYAQADEYVSVIVHLQHQAPIAEIDAELKAGPVSLRARHQQIVSALQAAARTQDELLDELAMQKRDGGVLGYTSYWITNAIVVQALPADIERIAQRHDVDFMELNFVPELITPVFTGGDDAQKSETDTRGIGVTPGLEAINAPRVWQELGITGAGRLIGSLDTGVDGNHPALASRWRGNDHPDEECWLDVLGTGTTTPNDGHGHGTHTTGTMTGVAPDDTVGVAWEASWIAANAINQSANPGFDNDIIECFQWFTDPDGNPDTMDDVPDVVQNSWGVNENFDGYEDCDNRWWAVIDNCEAAGVVTCWSAGNEGPGSRTMRSPADRADGPYNCFSVGAVDATNYGWPYPIAGFSSRGPSGCPVIDPSNGLKPEISAPGVDVYSSVPGGGYSAGYSGTSMAGPHVAGVVALMRQANPDLGVDLIKQILMDTAIDEGVAGEDNTYGWGHLDAYEAVLACMSGFGQIEGQVFDALIETPVASANVDILDTFFDYQTDAEGRYAGAVAPGNYTLQVSAPGYETVEVSGVNVYEDATTIQDFALLDNQGPFITSVSEPLATDDVTGPYAIDAMVSDPGGVDAVTLYYRVGNGAWNPMSMVADGDHFSAGIPGQSANTRIDYYVLAADVHGQETLEPAGAPVDVLSLFVTQNLYAYESEDPADPDWQIGLAGDTAGSGLWVRADPVGVYYESGGITTQPEDDHTLDPGVQCFVTGNGSPGGAPGDQDVDGGCTTLVSPVFALGAVDRAYVSYWRWYGEGGFSVDDEFAVDVSNDGGTTWQPLERVPDLANSWQQVAVDLNALVAPAELSDQVVFRFVACDLNSGGLVEAAIDDFSIQTFTDSGVAATPDEVANPLVLNLGQNYPNPFNPVTTIDFAVPRAGQVLLEVFTVDGRRVRTLVNEEMATGQHRVSWDGMDTAGQRVASGTYFYRLQAGDAVQTRSMILVK